MSKMATLIEVSNIPNFQYLEHITKKKNIYKYMTLQEAYEIAIEKYPRVIFNMKDVKYINSSNLGIILAKADENQLGVCSMEPEIKAIFKMLEIESVIPCFETVEECLSEMDWEYSEIIVAKIEKNSYRNFFMPVSL